MRNFYKEGDHLVICARSGQKALRSDCVREWTGQIVLKEYAEKRHPLDRQMPPPKESVPRDTRPPGDDVFIDPGDVVASDL